MISLYYIYSNCNIAYFKKIKKSKLNCTLPDICNLLWKQPFVQIVLKKREQRSPSSLP